MSSQAHAQLVSNLFESLVDFRGAFPGPLDIFILRGEKKFRGAEALGDSLTSGRAPTAAQGPLASRDCPSVDTMVTRRQTVTVCISWSLRATPEQISLDRR